MKNDCKNKMFSIKNKIMKKILLLLILLLTSVGVDAQWKMGRLKQDFDAPYRTYYIDGNRWVFYTENRNSTVTFYENERDASREAGICSKRLVDKNVEFTGFYFGEVTDPVDNYVNVRKGQGTKYPVVGKLSVWAGIFIKKTDTNWLKVYILKYKDEGVVVNEDGYFFSPLGGSCLCNLDAITCDAYNEKKELELFFIGYIYKDRVTNPNN